VLFAVLVLVLTRHVDTTVGLLIAGNALARLV
jgi:hypothetical protein